MPGKKKLTLDSPATYEVCIQAVLDESWRQYLNAVSMEVQNGDDGLPVTVLICEFIDQAALKGALNYIYSMGLALRSVKCIGVEPDTPA